MKEKPINRIAVDFDNTICNTKFNPDTGRYDMGEVYEPMREVIKDQYENGREIVIFTARPKKEWYKVLNYLSKNEIPYTKIKKKLLADVYIDDRNLRPDEAYIWNRTDLGKKKE